MKKHTDSHAADECLDGALARRVDGVLGDGLGLARDGPHEDQAAANLEVLVRLAGDEELAAGVDVEDAVKLLGGDVLDVAERNDAAVGAHNVEPAKLLVGLLKHADDLLDLGHVGLDGGRVGAVLLDLVDHLLRSRVAVGVVDDDLGAATSQLEGHLAANATTCGTMSVLLPVVVSRHHERGEVWGLARLKPAKDRPARSTPLGVRPSMLVSGVEATDVGRGVVCRSLGRGSDVELG